MFVAVGLLVAVAVGLVVAVAAGLAVAVAVGASAAGCAVVAAGLAGAAGVSSVGAGDASPGASVVPAFGEGVGVSTGLAVQAVSPSSSASISARKMSVRLLRIMVNSLALQMKLRQPFAAMAAAASGISLRSQSVIVPKGAPSSVSTEQR